MKVSLPSFHCLRCEHSWFPRKPEKPLRCGKCGSPYWDRKRQRRVRVEGKEVRVMGIKKWYGDGIYSRNRQRKRR